MADSLFGRETATTNGYGHLADRRESLDLRAYPVYCLIGRTPSKTLTPRVIAPQSLSHALRTQVPAFGGDGDAGHLGATLVA